MLWKCCTNMPANLENSVVATGLEKFSFHSTPKDRQCQRMLKLPHNFPHLTMLTKQCSKFSKPGFSSTWTKNFQMIKLDLENAEEPEIKLPTSVGSLKNKRVPEKHQLLLYWLCQSLWLCGSQETVENSERDGNTRPPDLPLEKPICKSGSNS